MIQNNEKKFRGVTDENQFIGEDENDTRLVQKMLQRAEEYLQGHSWCPPIVGRFVGFAVGGVVGAFLFKLAKKVEGSDDWLWVIEGDLPSAYLVTDELPNSAAALEAYCELMEDWSNAVLERKLSDQHFPVNVPSTAESANMLLSRIKFIREELIPIAAKASE